MSSKKYNQQFEDYMITHHAMALWKKKRGEKK